MQTKIWAALPNYDSYEAVEIFGYKSKSIPGLEIIGIGSYGRTLKEKLIFLSREFGIKFSPHRFTICIDGLNSKKIGEDNLYQWLELPMAILFWSLSGNLPIQKLDDCLAFGKLNLQGQVNTKNISKHQIELMHKKNMNLKLIGDSDDYPHVLSASELISQIRA